MKYILQFLLRHINFVLIISISAIVLLATVIIYEIRWRNMVRTNNKTADIHYYEIHTLNYEISTRDTSIAEITYQNNILRTDIAAIQDEIIYANRNRHIVENRFNDLQQQFDNLQQRYWEMGTSHNVMWMLGLLDMDAPLITHPTTDPDKIDMIIRHFNAMYSGDLDAYLLTLSNGHEWVYPGVDLESDDGESNWTWTDWMLITFRNIAEQEYYRMEVKFIPDWWYFNQEWGRQTSGHLPVWVLVQETPESEPFLRFYPLGVTSRGGPNWNEWKIFDYH